MTEEIFDVVDLEDKVVGRESRTTVHGNPQLIHRVAHVLVFNSKGDLYLQKRSRLKDVQPGKWDTSVGGHLDSGETYYQAAKREMCEELGISSADITFLYKYLHSNDFESEYVSTFVCFWDGEININRDEIETGAFWRLDDIAEREQEGIFTPNFLDELKRYKRFQGESAQLKIAN